MNKKSTSWGTVADWYHEHLNSEDTYHSKVVVPNLLRVMKIEKGDRVLDLACGEGLFAKKIHETGALVNGADISPELIALARKSLPDADFNVTPSHDLSAFNDGFFDKISCVLAIQNIEKVKETVDECYRVLDNGGKLFIVLNHPAFRIPKVSSWGWDGDQNIQYRRVDSYMTEAKVNIDMNPGKKDKVETISFHRPLQYYFKLFHNAGFAVSRLEEWISHKDSQDGPRKIAEDKARREIPLFMCMEIVKCQK